MPHGIMQFFAVRQGFNNAVNDLAVSDFFNSGQIVQIINPAQLQQAKISLGFNVLIPCLTLIAQIIENNLTWRNIAR